MIGEPLLKLRTVLFETIVCSPSSERWTKMGTPRSNDMHAFSSSSSSGSVNALASGKSAAFRWSGELASKKGAGVEERGRPCSS